MPVEAVSDSPGVMAFSNSSGTCSLAVPTSTELFDVDGDRLSDINLMLGSYAGF